LHTLMNSAFVVQGVLLGAAAWLLGQALAGRSRGVLLAVGALTAVGYALPDPQRQCQSFS
jgi:hypothetical protein